MIQTKIIDHAATVILNRPDRGNAVTRELISELSTVIEDLYYEKRVRAIILTGAGDTFCRGADVEEMHRVQSDPNAAETWGAEATELCDLLVRMLEITKPIIAAVNGPALGVGAALVAAADLVIAGHGASIGLPDVRHGLVAGLAAPLINFRIGAGHAARMMLAANPLDASEALRLGLFHELVADDKVWARAMQVAGDCAAGAPEAMQLAKRLLNETVGDRLATQLAAAAALTATARTTEAAAEGINALRAGRPPQWK